MLTRRKAITNALTDADGDSMATQHITNAVLRMGYQTCAEHFRVSIYGTLRDMEQDGEVRRVGRLRGRVFWILN